MFIELFTIIVVLLIADYLWKRKTNKLFKNIPGPTNLPLIGAVLLYLDTKPDELLKLAHSIKEKYGRISKFWIFHINAIFISDVKYIQAMLSHPTEIKKNRMYSLLNQWLGEGLLLSHGPKWLARRRAITPAFHFKILDNFIPIFDQQAAIFAAKLNKHAVDNTVTQLDEMADSDRQRCVIDIEHYVALATLDVICETAMSVKINAQTNEQCEYVQNLIEMQHIFLERFVSMVYRSDTLFKIANPILYSRYRKVMKALHNFTDNIIRERRAEIQKDSQSESGNHSAPGLEDDEGTSEANIYGLKKRMALLDVLLSSTIDGQPLSNADIREEVDTFMFEGHDTTKSGIGFTLYALSREQEVQQKLYEEVKDVIGLDPNESLTYNKLMDLKYMDKVIKESLRMYPPVPFFGRQIMQDIYLDDQCIPAGTSILMGIMTMQNDPLYFKEPHRFLPDRELPEKGFVFLPFSAGPRNCIGQRFAMLEMKAFLTRIIQSYELLPLGEKIQPTISVVLKSKTGWQMGFKKRN